MGTPVEVPSQERAEQNEAAEEAWNPSLTPTASPCSNELTIPTHVSFHVGFWKLTQKRAREKSVPSAFSSICYAGLWSYQVRAGL